MSHRKPHVLPALANMAWGTIGGLRKSRDKLPYSSRLITYLLSDQSGEGTGFLVGQWLATLEDDALAFLFKSAFLVSNAVQTHEEMEIRADLVMLVELALFEEKQHRNAISVTKDGFVPAIYDFAICTGLEMFRRRKWAVVGAISINIELVGAMVTPAGKCALRDSFDDDELAVFSWIELQAPPPFFLAH